LLSEVLAVGRNFFFAAIALGDKQLLECQCHLLADALALNQFDSSLVGLNRQILIVLGKSSIAQFLPRFAYFWVMCCHQSETLKCVIVS
jgi:hypothetical protein